MAELLGALFLLGILLLMLYGLVAFLKALARPQATPKARATPVRTTPRSPATSATGQPTLAEQLRESVDAWVPPGGSIAVAGMTIPGGMVYCGGGLRALRGGSFDPALIDPRLPIGRHPDMEGRGMFYWPSYSEVPADSRAAYLHWLANGRRDPRTFIGYVFLFFYGIERRVLLDAQSLDLAKEEVPLLLSEVESLLDVYASNRLFRGYALSFLDIARVSVGIDDGLPDLPSASGAWQIPLSLRYGLGKLVSEGRPLPAEWALAWLRHHPQAYLRTPAKRCPEEFARLFASRYEQKHGTGMLLKPNKTYLTLSYRPASSSFGGEVRIDAGGLPDVTALTAPLKRFQEIADSVSEELDAYSRWVGRSEDRHSLAAVALLPPEVARGVADEETRDFIGSLERRLGKNGMAVVKPAELVAIWPTSSGERLPKKEASKLADLLSSFGLGIEPDVRFGGRNPTHVEHVVLYRSLEPVTPPGERFAAATVLLHFGAAVATADELTVDEERHLERHLEETLHLEEADRRRLRAHLHWLLVSPPNLSGLKRRLSDLAVGERQRIGRFLIRLAGADGRVSSEEIKVLGRIYPVLGLPQADVYSDLHAMSAGGRLDSGPVEVISAGERPGHAIPGLADQETAEMIVLDREQIETIRMETREVTRVLTSIFAEDESTERVASDATGGEPKVGDAEGAAGLDPAHTALLRALSGLDRLTLSQFESLAGRFGVMPAGALESLNEASFEITGEPLLEGDDPIDVTPHAVEMMLS